MTPFKNQLRENVRKYIRAAKRAGTVKMSLANLRQCVPTPSTNLDGAPMGTNAQWSYAQLFAEICQEAGVKSFLLA